MIDASKYVFFWMTGEYNEEFSNWYPCEFTVDDQTYCHVEQYFMAQKALTFDDQETFEKIMVTTDPSACKKLGREIKNYDNTQWSNVRRDIMFEGNYAKFSQNETLKKKLLQTGNRTMVEASPYDKIWGIGMWAQEAFYVDETKWPGQNLMGKCLIEVRKRLVQEMENEKREAEAKTGLMGALAAASANAKMPKQNQEDTIRMAFFDVDGVLSAPIFTVNGKQRVGLGSGEDWIRYCVHKGSDAYFECKPVPSVFRYAKKLKDEGVLLYVLSTSKTSFESNAKRKFVETHYPELFEDVITVASDEMKLMIIQYMAEEAKIKVKQCELIEDALPTLLQACEKGIKTTHISNLVV